MTIEYGHIKTYNEKVLIKKVQTWNQFQKQSLRLMH